MARLSTTAFLILWVILAAIMIFIVTLPISLQAHLVTGTIVVGGMIMLKVLKPEGMWRLIALALGSSLVLRYVYWRSTNTLPPVSELENFIPGLVLYLAEMYSVGMLFLSLFVVSTPLPSRTPVVLADKDLPNIDIFIPTYNEEAGLLATTIAAVRGMDYPPEKFSVWLLDDGGTDQKCGADDAAAAVVAQRRRVELTALAESLDARYLTRSRNEHAKAGNLNNGLEHTDSELIAVFDADHAPARSFLRETVGHFSVDPKLFLVQTPHFFINPDPVERNLGTFDKMPSENEMFYGVIQRGLDKWDAAFFCGSAAVLRREALAITNGFSGISITEDCETALELHSRGWHSIYVDKPLIAGLQPETFASFIGQRTRWAQGMMQILRFRMPPLKRGLSFPQRLCYMSSTMFWLFPLTRLTFLIAPLFYLFFGLQIFVASGAEFLAYTMTYIIVNLMMQNYIYGRYRWPWISELYELVQSIYIFPALISVALNPRKPTFKVTSKSENVGESRVSEIGYPFFIIFFILVFALVVAIYRIITDPFRADVTFVVGLWNLLNLVLVGCALGAVSELHMPRRAHRVHVARRCNLIVGNDVISATIEDVSIGGIRVRPAPFAIGDLRPGALISVRFAALSSGPSTDLPLVLRRIEKIDDDLVLGCQFLPQEANDYRMIADLMFANADQWSRFLESRRNNPGVVGGTIFFFSTAIYQTGRGLSYFFGLQRRKAVSAMENAKAEPETKA